MSNADAGYSVALAPVDPPGQQEAVEQVDGEAPHGHLPGQQLGEV